MSSTPTKYKFRDFKRIVCKIAEEKDLYIKIINKPGSARRFEVFKNGDYLKPISFWVNHEAKFIYTRDMKKCLKPLGITEEKLIKTLDEN
ncbi:MAG: hypothetical protein PWQ56_127 [Patescibacteria group bacterium]|nr:hypothetical protein [Patescibacteria group bacterium]